MKQRVTPAAHVPYLSTNHGRRSKTGANNTQNIRYFHLPRPLANQSPTSHGGGSINILKSQGTFPLSLKYIGTLGETADELPASNGTAAW